MDYPHPRAYVARIDYRSIAGVTAGGRVHIDAATRDEAAEAACLWVGDRPWITSAAVTITEVCRP